MEDLLIANHKLETFTIAQSDLKPFIIVNEDGELIQFDNELCRQLADGFDQGRRENYIFTAKFIISVLDEAAKEVDHILKAGGGTQGDLIREFDVKRKA